MRPGFEDEFLRRLHDLVADVPTRYAGLLGHEVLVDRDDRARVLHLSRWQDEAAVAGFAGPDWASVPVTFPGEEELLTGPLALRHLVLDDGS